MESECYVGDFYKFIYKIENAYAKLRFILRSNKLVNKKGI